MFSLNKLARNLSYSKYYQTFYRVRIIQKVYRNFRCTPQLSIKMYMEHENTHAYNILESKGYAASIKTLPKRGTTTKDEFDKLLQRDWSKQRPNELFQTFSILGDYCSEHKICVSNKIFDNFIDNLTDNIKQASNEELKNLFYILNKWPEPESARTRNYIEVWVALDDECLNRMKYMSFDEMLSFTALFYMLNVIRKSEFCNKVIQKLASKAKQLTPGQLVQAFFYIGICRRSPFDMHNLEVILEEKLSQFTIEEISIISMGFFKSKTPIRSLDLVNKIIDLVIQHSKSINEVSLAALLKIIRYSIKITFDDHVFKLIDTLQHEIPRLSIMCNVHLALLGTTTLTFHKECLNKMASHLINSLDETRLKDLERLILTYGTFNLKPETKECFFTKVTNELRRPERDIEIFKYGRSFACCVSYLGLLGLYPVDLISKALSPEFLEKTFGKQCHAYTNSILVLHNTAEIFCGGEEMNRLSKKCAIILAKKFTDFVPNEGYKKQYNVTERMMLDIIQTLKLKLGDQYVVADHILTHHQRGGKEPVVLI